MQRQNNLTRLEAHAIAARSCGPRDRASRHEGEIGSVLAGPAERQETSRGSTAQGSRAIVGSFVSEFVINSLKLARCPFPNPLYVGAPSF